METDFQNIWIGARKALSGDIAALFDHKAYQEELPYIVRTAFAKFVINRDKLRRYARRRNRLEQVEQLLGQSPPAKH